MKKEKTSEFQEIFKASLGSRLFDIFVKEFGETFSYPQLMIWRSRNRDWTFIDEIQKEDSDRIDKFFDRYWENKDEDK